ncbi:hypothetical protein BO82DRAFT_396375 [Aspergillus uvarum CBS 121591]|uniref:Uncharacterized protein n=1 Tax=Aspergillus uvarum CBS 121591 TaxID=1448315 RepID=A0A319BV14_9EURO|nr:hypothetical protein BO82DRAFT_396375 [Aspergillus uvarum CBS 121591]PYH76067.1 hypothetical protein BO82DRAFT_396375 [Aspergillus uvarum CBS 121591]
MCRMEIHIYSCTHIWALRERCSHHQMPNHQELPARNVTIASPCLICRDPPIKHTFLEQRMLFTIQSMESILGMSRHDPGFADSVTRFYARGDHGRWMQPGYLRPRSLEDQQEEEAYYQAVLVSSGQSVVDTAAVARPAASTSQEAVTMNSSSASSHSTLNTEPQNVAAHPPILSVAEVQSCPPIVVENEATGSARLVLGPQYQTLGIGESALGTLLEHFGTVPAPAFVEVSFASRPRKAVVQGSSDDPPSPYVPMPILNYGTVQQLPAIISYTDPNIPFGITPAIQNAPQSAGFSESPQSSTHEVSQDPDSPDIVTGHRNLAQSRDDPFFNPASARLNVFRPRPAIPPARMRRPPNTPQSTPALNGTRPRPQTGGLMGPPALPVTRRSWLKQPADTNSYWQDLDFASYATPSTGPDAPEAVPEDTNDPQTNLMSSPTVMMQQRRSGEIRRGKRPVRELYPVLSTLPVDGNPNGNNRPNNAASANPNPRMKAVVDSKPAAEPKAGPEPKRPRFVRFLDDTTIVPCSPISTRSLGRGGGAVHPRADARLRNVCLGGTADAAVDGFSLSGFGDQQQQGNGTMVADGDKMDLDEQKGTSDEPKELEWMFQCYLTDEEDKRQREESGEHPFFSSPFACGYNKESEGWEGGVGDEDWEMMQ